MQGDNVRVLDVGQDIPLSDRITQQVAAHDPGVIEGIEEVPSSFPYTSKYLLRRYLDPPNPPNTFSEGTTGGLGFVQGVLFTDRVLIVSQNWVFTSSVGRSDPERPKAVWISHDQVSPDGRLTKTRQSSLPGLAWLLSFTAQKQLIIDTWILLLLQLLLF